MLMQDKLLGHFKPVQASFGQVIPESQKQTMEKSRRTIRSILTRNLQNPREIIHIVLLGQDITCYYMLGKVRTG
jgi:hypothetical protein